VSLTKTTPDPLRDQAVDWLMRLRSENCSVGERLEFEHWLAKSPRHRQAYEQVERYWVWMEPFKAISFSARDKALQYRRKPRLRLIVYAAAAALLLSAGLTFLLLPDGLITPKTYQVAKGQRQVFALADGSSMELNTDSMVRVQINPWRRKVELLRGEAFFKVVHNSQIPFEVRAGNVAIRDIGTAFEVYKKAGQVLVAVQEGVVEVETQGRHRLNAGQQITYTESGDILTVEPQDIANLTAWRQGQLVFRGRRLDDVLAEVGRYHDKHIRLQDSKLAALRVSGTFPTDRLDSLLNAVARILPVSVERLGNDHIVLKRAVKAR
jgi:transmembrane sensor